jgi:histidinol dehydrogenase
MSGLQLAVEPGKRISELTAAERDRLLERGRARDGVVMQSVSELIAAVRQDGDAALREQAFRFDGVHELNIEVPRTLWRKALAGLDARVRAGLEAAAANIATFHRAQLPDTIEIEPQPGLKLGRRADPLERVAVYARAGWQSRVSEQRADGRGARAGGRRARGGRVFAGWRAGPAARRRAGRV